MSVPSIGELFQAYPAATSAVTKTSFVPLLSAAIVIALLRNLWNLSTSKPL